MDDGSATRAATTAVADSPNADGIDPRRDADTSTELGATPTFDDFYRREFPSLVAFARALWGSAYADDVAQDAMLTAYRHWDRVSGLDVPAAWVRRVCANAAVSAHRRRLVEARALLRVGSWRQPAAVSDEDHEVFWSEVRRLPRRQAQAVALFYVLDLGVTEIARTLQCSEGTVKVHLSRGRAALAQRLGVQAEVEQ